MGKITIQDDSIKIEEFEIFDKDIVKYFKNLVENEVEDHFLAAVKLGITSLEFSSTTKDVLIVDNAFNEMKDKFNQTLEEFLGENGIISQNLDNNEVKITEVLKEYIGDDGKLCQFFDENNKQSFISKIQDLISAQLDVTNEDSAFFELKKILTNELVQIGKSLGVREGTKEERKKGTAKGKDFEEYVNSVLDPFAKIFEDTIEMTGDTLGKLPNNKKGDLVIMLNPKHTGGLEKKIVIEVKDKAMTFKGKKSLFEELDEAMQNRDAQYGIFVWSLAHATNQIGTFRTYPPSKVVCTVDLDEEEPDTLPLEMAYKIARAEIISQLKGEEIQIDRDKLNELIKKAIDRINQASSIKGGITKITKNLNGLKTDIDSLREDSIDLLKQIEAIISGS